MMIEDSYRGLQWWWCTCCHAPPNVPLLLLLLLLLLLVLSLLWAVKPTTLTNTDRACSGKDAGSRREGALQRDDLIEPRTVQSEPVRLPSIPPLAHWLFSSRF
jgi:hypothetical protein